MRWPRPHTPPGYSRGRTNCFAKPPAATRWGGPVTPGGIWPRVRGPGGPARRALPPGSAPGIVGWDPVMGIGPPGMWAGQVPGKAPGPKDPAGEEPAGPWPKSGRGAGSRIPFGRRLPGLERGSGPKAVPSQRGTPYLRRSRAKSGKLPLSAIPPTRILPLGRYAMLYPYALCPPKLKAQWASSEPSSAFRR